MMYQGKTILAAGCSHTYGEYLNDHDRLTCHVRSWVHKLQDILGFDNYVNLSYPGGSNKRAVRLLTDYVIHYPSPEKLVVFLGVAETARTEFFVNKNPQHYVIDTMSDHRFGHNTAIIGPWTYDLLPKEENTFLGQYYLNHYNDCFENHILNLELQRFSGFLKYNKIEHYFPLMQGQKQELLKEKNSQQLPYIFFDQLDAVQYARHHGFKIGSENNDKNIICNHLNHDGHQFVAEYIAKSILNDS